MLPPVGHALGKATLQGTDLSPAVPEAAISEKCGYYPATRGDLSGSDL